MVTEDCVVTDWCRAVGLAGLDLRHQIERAGVCENARRGNIDRQADSKVRVPKRWGSSGQQRASAYAKRVWSAGAGPIINKGLREPTRRQCSRGWCTGHGEAGMH